MAVGGRFPDRETRDRLWVAVVVALSVFIDLRLLGLVERMDLPARVTGPMTMMASHAVEIAFAVLAVGFLMAASRTPIARKA